MRCPECRSKKIIKAGWAVTRKEGRKQRFQCRSCGRVFYEKKTGGKG